MDNFNANNQNASRAQPPGHGNQGAPRRTQYDDSGHTLVAQGSSGLRTNFTMPTLSETNQNSNPNRGISDYPPTNYQPAFSRAGPLEGQQRPSFQLLPSIAVSGRPIATSRRSAPVYGSSEQRPHQSFGQPLEPLTLAARPSAQGRPPTRAQAQHPAQVRLMTQVPITNPPLNLEIGAKRGLEDAVEPEDLGGSAAAEDASSPTKKQKNVDDVQVLDPVDAEDEINLFLIERVKIGRFCLGTPAEVEKWGRAHFTALASGAIDVALFLRIHAIVERKFMMIIEAFVFSDYFHMPPKYDIVAVRTWIAELLKHDFFLHAEMHKDYEGILKAEQNRRLASKVKFHTEKGSLSKYENRADPPLILHFTHVGLLQTAGEMFMSFPLHIIEKIWKDSTADPRMVITASAMIQMFLLNVLRGQMTWDPLAEFPSEIAKHVEVCMAKQSAMASRAQHIANESDEATTLLAAATRIYQYVVDQQTLLQGTYGVWSRPNIHDPYYPYHHLMAAIKPIQAL